MAFSSLSNAWTTWYLAQRNGGVGSGTPGTCLVSDLAVGDYLVGARCKITATGSTTSGVRSLTVDRNGITSTIQQVAASSVVIIRP